MRNGSIAIAIVSIDVYIFEEASSNISSSSNVMFDHRLLGSTKYGKTSSAMLRVASANQYPFPDNFSNSILYEPKGQFEEALKQNVKYLAKPRVCSLLVSFSRIVVTCILKCHGKQSTGN